MFRPTAGPSTDDAILFLPSRLSLPHLLPALLHTLSATPAFTSAAPLPNIIRQWQNARGASAYLQLLSQIVPTVTSLTAEHNCYLTSHQFEETPLNANLRAAITTWHQNRSDANHQKCTDAQVQDEEIMMKIESERKKIDALRRIGDLLENIAGLLGRAVVVEGEANEAGLDLGVVHDFGEARRRLASLRVDIVEVAGRVEAVCGELNDLDDIWCGSTTGASRSMQQVMERTAYESLGRAQGQVQTVDMRSVLPAIKEEDEQDMVLPSVETMPRSFRPGSPPRSPPPFPPRLSKAWDDEVGVVDSQHESQDEMPTTRVKTEEDLEIDDGREPEGVFRMSP